MIQQRAQTIDDRQAQAEPDRLPDVGRLEPIKLAKDAFVLIFGNTGAGIPDFDPQLALAFAAADQHAAGRRVTDGIGNQVENDPLQQDAVAADPGAAADNAKRQAFFPRRLGKRRLDPLQQLRHRIFGELGREYPGIQLGHVEQRVEQFVHDRERRLDSRHDFLSLRGPIAKPQLLDEQAERVQRLAQIVAGGREEARLGLRGELELFRALVYLAFQIR